MFSNSIEPGMFVGVIIVEATEEFSAVNPDNSEMLNPDDSPAENPA